MEDMSAVAATGFDRNCELHLKHLKLKGLQPKTIEAYARAIRRVGDYFDHQIDDLSETDLLDYFTDLRETHSWSSVKLDLYGLKFHYEHVLKKPWVAPGLVKPPRTQRLPDILTVEETERIFLATQVLSYRVFFFTLYSLGLRLGEGLRLTVADIDGARQRVQSAMPRATRIACCRCRRPRTSSCAVSGSATAIPSCCFPIGTAGWRAHAPRRHRSIAAACRKHCGRWSNPAV